MLTLPVVICNYFLNQGLLKLIPRGRNFSKVQSTKSTSKLEPKKNRSKLLQETTSESIDKQVRLAAKLINDYKEPKNIIWDDLINKLKESNVSNTRSAVLQGCLRLANSKAGLSYYDYLLKNNEKITLVDYVIFSKLFVVDDSILKNETLVKNLYDSMKDHINKSPLIQEFLLHLVSENPNCFLDFLERCKGITSKTGKELILTKALDYDYFDLMLQNLTEFDSSFSENFIKSYLNYVSRMAVNGKFIPELITTLTDICEKNVSTICTPNLPTLLTSFVDEVNQTKNNYHWSAKATTLNRDNVCLECGLKLLDKQISNSDFNALRENSFLKLGFLNKNIFITSTQKEFESFLNFLHSSKPYDIVIDFLNIFYQSKHQKTLTCILVINYFVERGLNVLVIAKKHMKEELLKNTVLKTNFQDTCQFFFTENSSDDDVFQLYAAMYKGPGIYIISKDYFSRYIQHLDDQFKGLFLKWKIYHQFLYVKGHIVPPRPHLGLPQLTLSNHKKKAYVWHLSHRTDSALSRLESDTELKWVCLKAVKK